MPKFVDGNLVISKITKPVKFRKQGPLLLLRKKMHIHKAQNHVWIYIYKKWILDRPKPRSGTATRRVFIFVKIGNAQAEKSDSNALWYLCHPFGIIGA
jgi:hypothetical protein